MAKAPQKRTPELKLKLALEALKGEKTLIQIASDYGIHPRQITRWRDQLLEEAQKVFIHKATQKSADPDKEQLLRVIDQLSSELEFIKKKLKRNN
jgi:transposase